MVPCFLARYAAAGGDVAVLARTFGVPERIELASDLKLPMRRLRALTERIAADLGDPDVGITTALHTPRGAYGLLEYLARNMTKLGDAGRAFVHYSMRRGQHVEYALETYGTEARYQFRLPGDALCFGRHGNEFSLLMVVRLARELAQLPDLSPARVWFSHPAPADLTAVGRAFGVTPEFGCESNGLAIPIGALEIPVRSPDPALRTILHQELEARLPRAPDPVDVVSRVEHRVHVCLREDVEPSIERVSADLHLSARTLQRQLGEAKTTFHDVLERVRRTLAEEYLADPSRDVKWIAHALGYSDASAFARAYKRWTGSAPAHAKKG